MPPSIARRESPLSSMQDDAAPRSKQSLDNFQARRKLLAAAEASSKRKQAKKVASSSATKKADPSPVGASVSPVDNTYNSALLSTSPYGGLGTGLGYGGMMGMGGMGGMYSSPYGMMGMGMGMGPLTGLNQFLFGVQTAVYSLSSAIQVIGMNTQALQQLLDVSTTMLDHAMATWHEMQVLESSNQEQETEEQKLRRRRLKTLRWAMVAVATYAAYRLLKGLLSTRKSKSRKRLTAGVAPTYSSSPNPAYAQPLTGNGGYGLSSYPNVNGYGGMSPYGSSYGAGGGYGGYY